MPSPSMQGIHRKGLPFILQGVDFTLSGNEITNIYICIFSRFMLCFVCCKSCQNIQKSKTMRIIDYVDFSCITSLMSENPLIPNLFFSITDLEGKTLASSRWQRVCSDFHRECPATRSLCVKSDIVLANEIKKGQDYAFYSCLNSLVDAAAPIRCKDEVIGNLIVGQVFTKPPDMDFFEQQAKAFGFDKEAYIRAIQEVPVIEEEKLRNLMSFYARFASLFGSIANEAYNYKLMADTLAHRTAELEYVNGELESFSYSVSHDLRAPLRHIIGYVDLFNRRNKGELSPQGAHYFDAIRESAEEMGSLIDDLLHYSRNGRAELIRTSIDMNATVNDHMRKFSDSHPDRNVVWHISSLPEAYADIVMIKYVWQNLIDNALKFTNKKDQASVSIGFLPSEGAYYIRDNGVGFDMKYAGKLFGMFQRLHSKDEFEGTGIGLASAKRIISRHGGRIWAEAEVNKGACFYFTLPGKD